MAGGASYFDDPMPFATVAGGLTDGKESLLPKPPKPPSKPKNSKSNSEDKSADDPDRPNPKELREDYLDRVGVDIPPYPLPPWRGAGPIPPQLARILKIQHYIAIEDMKREELEKDLERDDMSIRSVGRARHKILNPDDCLEHDLQSQLNAILVEIIRGEVEYQHALEVLFTHYLEPISAAKVLSPGTQDALVKFIALVSNMIKLHHELELQAKQSSGSLELLTTLETFEALFDNVYPDYMNQMPFFATETAPDRVAAMQNLMQTMEKDSSGNKRTSMLVLLDEPVKQIESYGRRLTLLQRLLPPSHPSVPKLKRLLKRFRDKERLLTEALAVSKEGASLSDLEAKVVAVPDNWCVRDSRHLHGATVVTIIFGPAEQLDSSVVHPHKSKKAESCRLFLLDHCLLMTSWEYKYRQRFDLNEIAAVSRGERLMALTKEFLTFPHSATRPDEEDPSTAVVFLFSSFQERYTWIQRISDVMDRMTMKMSNAYCRLTDDSGKWSEAQLLAEERDREPGKLYDQSSPVNVFFRIRPFITKDESEKGTSVIHAAGQFVALENTDRYAQPLAKDDPDQKQLNLRIGVYARIFSGRATQMDVLSRVETEPLDALMSGRDALVFAYGGIGTGKTYTMFGDEQLETRGLVQHLIDQVFARLKKAHCEEEKSTLSCVQVHSDKLQDVLGGKVLLEAKSVLPRLPGEFGGVLKELTKTPVTTGREAAGLVKEALKSRVLRSHPLNECSSRSHLILILRIKCKLDGVQKRMALWLVDLAGFDTSGPDPTDAVHPHDIQDRILNAGVVSLERVINAIGENKRRTRHKKLSIPWGESKLTSALEDILGSDCVCSVILTASPSPLLSQTELTTKTMRFGESAKKYGGHRYGGQQSHVRQESWLDGLHKRWKSHANF